MGKQFTLYLAEEYSEPCQASKMKLLVKIVNNFQSFTIFAKHSILDVWEGSEYVSVQYKYVSVQTNKPNKIKKNQEINYIKAYLKHWKNLETSLTTELNDLGGDYMIPACRDEISIRPAETDFTLRLHVEIKLNVLLWIFFN